VLGRDPRRDLFAALRAAVVEQDLCAFGARAFDLHLRRIGRHDDHRSNAKPAGCNGHSAGVIAGRESDHAPLPFLLVELEQAVGRTAELEGSAGLQALALQEDSNTADLIRDQRGAFDESRDARRGRNYVVYANFSYDPQAVDLPYVSLNRCASATDCVRPLRCAAK